MNGCAHTHTQSRVFRRDARGDARRYRINRVDSSTTFKVFPTKRWARWVDLVARAKNRGRFRTLERPVIPCRARSNTMFAGDAHLYSLQLLLPSSKVRKLWSELVTAPGIEKLSLEDLLLALSAPLSFSRLLPFLLSSLLVSCCSASRGVDMGATLSASRADIMLSC